ncbi:MAG: hypothetical protein R2825_19375 [Saprospiraceae bacterium]
MDGGKGIAMFRPGVFPGYNQVGALGSFLMSIVLAGILFVFLEVSISFWVGLFAAVSVLLFGFYILIGREIKYYKLKKRTAYFVTNERLVFHLGWPKTREYSIDYQDLNKVIPVKYDNVNLAAIYFHSHKKPNFRTYYFNTKKERPLPTFEDIEDVDNVIRIIKKSKAAFDQKNKTLNQD